MSKTILIVVMLLVSIGAYYYYLSNQLPEGVEAKGEDLAKSYVSLATSIVSLLTAVVTLILKLSEMKGKKRKSKKS
jgi:CBS domain containing-hemolysin-like protein